MVYYLEIIHTYPLLVDIDILTSVKAQGVDKHIIPMLYHYFKLCITLLKIFPENFTEEQSAKIFVQFINLFENGVISEEYPEFYELFKYFLNSNRFYSIFIENKCYLFFPYLSKFILEYLNTEGADFKNNADSVLGEEEVDFTLVRIGYDLPIYRKLIYSILRQRESSLNYYWLLAQGWYDEFSITEIFYNFHTCLCMDDLNFKGLNLYTEFKKDLKTVEQVINNSKHQTISDSKQQPLITNLEQQKVVVDSKYHETLDSSQQVINNLKDQQVINDLKQKQVVTDSTRQHFNSMEKIQHDGEEQPGNKNTSNFGQQLDNFNKGISNNYFDPVNFRLSNKISIKILSGHLCKLKNEEDLKKWTNTFNFYEMDILDALRLYLNTFQLSSESQVIDRVIHVFVHEFIMQNNIDYASFDNYYSLAYSFIFLNTLLHNPSISEKISFEEYKSKISGFESDLLKSYFIKIKENEICLPQKWTDSCDNFILYNNNYKIRPVDKVSQVVFAHNYLLRHYEFYNLDPKSFFNLCDDLSIKLSDCIINKKVYGHYNITDVFNQESLSSRQQQNNNELSKQQQNSSKELSKSIILNYLENKKSILSSYLLSFKLFMERFPLSNNVSLSNLILLIDKKYSKSPSVFKSIMGKNTSISKRRLETILRQIENAKFKSISLFCTNSIFLLEEIENLKNNNFHQQFTVFLNALILNNIFNINSFDDDVIKNQLEFLLNKLDRNVKIDILKNRFDFFPLLNDKVNLLVNLKSVLNKREKFKIYKKYFQIQEMKNFENSVPLGPIYIMRRKILWSHHYRVKTVYPLKITFIQ